MRGSVASELDRRVELMGEAFAFCRRGQFSLARFLALVPERLRLALGDDARRVRIPVGITADVRARLSALLPPGLHEPSGALHQDVTELKRVLRFAQIDPDLDVVRVARWLTASAEPLSRHLCALYTRGFAEVGRGEGGLETAYLVHHLVLEVLDASVRASGDRAAATAALLAPIVDSAIAAAGEARGDVLPARLGYQLALTTSPASLGAEVARVGERPASAYRTSPQAIALARRVVQEPLELIELSRVVHTLAERQLADGALHLGLRRAVLMELVRDGLLLLVAQAWTPGAAASLALGRELVGSARALEQHLFVTPRRAQLLAWLGTAGAGQRAAELVERLVSGADAVVSGDLTPLGVHADLRERAVTSARGAVLAVLDERIEALRRDVAARVEELPPSECDAAWREGRCYRLSLAEQPIHRAVARAAEGYLVIDLSALSRRLTHARRRGVGELVERAIFAPLSAAWAHALAGDAERVKVARWTAEQVAFRGDLVAMFELALEACARLEASTRALAVDVPDILGGGGTRARELAAEITRLHDRLATVEGALLRFSDDPASSRFLRDSHHILSRELASLSTARRHAEVVERPLEVGAYLALAEPGEVVAPPGALDHGGPITFSSAHAEASLGAAQAADAEPREARSPFRVRVLERPRVPGALHEALARALSARDREGLQRVLDGWLSEPAPIVDRVVDNVGCALSGAALNALAHDRRGVWTFEERGVSTEDLPRALRERFELGSAPLVLRAALSASDGELLHLFRAAGAQSGPALEREIAVWEHLPAHGEFVRALSAALAPEGAERAPGEG